LARRLRAQRGLRRGDLPFVGEFLRVGGIERVTRLLVLGVKRGAAPTGVHAGVRLLIIAAAVALALAFGLARVLAFVFFLVGVLRLLGLGTLGLALFIALALGLFWVALGLFP